MVHVDQLHLAEACRYRHDINLSELPVFTGDFSNYPADHVQFLRDFFLAQLDSYETGPSGVGWFMWTMKVEGEHEAGPEWDFLYLWRNGVIPADLCHRDKFCPAAA